MRNLLQIFLSLQSVMLSWTSIVSCGQKVKTSNKTSPEAKPSSSDKIKLTAAVNKLKNMNLNINVSELGKLDVLISAIKNDPSYKNIITEEGIELSKELQLQQEKLKVLITAQNESLIKDHSSFTVNAYLKLNNENMNTSFTVEASEKKQENILLEAETKLNESHLCISIKEFSNKKVTDKIKEFSTFKQNITNKNIEVVGDFDFFDKKTNEIINDKSEFSYYNIVIAQGLFKFGTYKQKLKFEIRLIGASSYEDLKKPKREIETLENSKINLLVLQNKSELIKKLEAAINNKKSIGEIQSNSLKIYNKSNGIEITDTNQKLIEDGLEIKVTLVLENSTDALLIEFNCKIVDKNMVDLEAAKNELENLSQLIEIKIGKTVNTGLLFNSILNHFKYNDYIANSNVILSDKLEFFDLKSQSPIVIDNIEFDTPFIVKTNISLNSSILPITFKLKLIHSTKLDLLATSIKKLQSYNGFKVYTTNKLIDFNIPNEKRKFLNSLFEIDEFKGNIVDVFPIDVGNFICRTKIINKTSGEELKQVTWGQKVTLKGIFVIREGVSPFDFDIVLTNPS